MDDEIRLEALCLIEGSAYDIQSALSGPNWKTATDPLATSVPLNLSP